MVSGARVNRRVLLGGGAVVLGASAAGLVALGDLAQVATTTPPPGVRRIGFLGPSTAVDLGFVDGLRQGLRDYGWA
jgi:hypothetical protein